MDGQLRASVQPQLTPRSDSPEIAAGSDTPRSETIRWYLWALALGHAFSVSRREEAAETSMPRYIASRLTSYGLLARLRRGVYVAIKPVHGASLQVMEITSRHNPRGRVVGLKRRQPTTSRPT